jgi:hypothetical protein
MLVAWDFEEKEDVAFLKQYLDDLEAAVAEAQKAVKFRTEENIKEVNNHAALMIPWMGRVSEHATDFLRPKYG